MPGAQPMTPAGLRPPAKAGFPQPDGTMQFNHQKARSPLMENSEATQLSNGEHKSTDSNFEAVAETDNKVENKEKMILDYKERLVFYRDKMQNLVLFKSRCDN